jgi:hypothetical protein
MAQWPGDRCASHGIPLGCYRRGDVHCTLRWWWIRSGGTAANGNGWRSATVSDQIDSASAVLVPEIDHEHEVSTVDIVGINLQSRFDVAHDQANARRRSDGASILKWSHV